MEEQKITKDIIISALGEWLKTYKVGVLPLSHEAVQQLYDVLTEDKPDE